MNNSGHSSRSFAILAIIVVLVVLAGVGYWGATKYATHQRATAQVSLAADYAPHALAAPFQLQNRAWVPASGPFATSGQWIYIYTANVTGPAAAAAVRSQLSPSSGFQVNANHPDVTSTSSATLYRDLITGDISLKIQIQAAQGDNFATGPVTAGVTITPLAGG